VRSIAALLTKTWFITAVTVVICAGFLAKAASSIIAAEALEDAPTSTLPPAPPRPPAPTRTKLDGTKVTRNIFCSDCEPAVVADTSGRYTGEPAILIATMMGPDPRATVRVLATEAQGSWGIGERIPGVGTIDRIGSTSIDVLDVGGRRGTLSLLDSSSPQPRRVDAATSTPRPDDPFAERVRKISETDYEVDRALVRELVTGTQKAGGVRAVPQMKGSEVNGLRILGARAGTVAAAVGIKSNDVITTIDGDPIKNIQQLLDLYAKLDQVSAVELGGTRAGKPLTLTLRLR
jgi:hypothetical protein